MLQLTQLVKTVDGHVILEFVLGVVAIECAPIFACGQYIQIVVAHTVGQCLTIVTLDESFDFGVGCVDVACTVAVVQLRFESVVFDVGGQRVATELVCELRGAWCIVAQSRGTQLFKRFVLGIRADGQ